jgi:hypothetical protein
MVQLEKIHNIFLLQPVSRPRFEPGTFHKYKVAKLSFTRTHVSVKPLVEQLVKFMIVIMGFGHLCPSWTSAIHATPLHNVSSTHVNIQYYRPTLTTVFHSDFPAKVVY